MELALLILGVPIHVVSGRALLCAGTLQRRLASNEHLLLEQGQLQVDIALRTVEFVAVTVEAELVAVTAALWGDPVESSCLLPGSWVLWEAATLFEAC